MISNEISLLYSVSLCKETKFNAHFCLEQVQAGTNCNANIFKIPIILIIGRVKFLIKTVLLWAISSKHVPLPQLHSVIFR